MTATYFILLDLKSRHKPIRLLPNRTQPINSRTLDGYSHHHHHPQASSIPANLLREKNQDTTPRSRTVHRHPVPADLLLMSQQDKLHLPPTNGNKSSHEHRHRHHKTPNKENVENSHTKRSERTTPTVK